MPTEISTDKIAAKIRAAIRRLSAAEAAALLFEWNFWSRQNQRAPEGPWANWLILAGRGFGKTRVGAEMVRRWIQDSPLVNLIGATASDARDIMVEGESGILAICPRHERPLYVPSKRRLEWPNGARSLIFTADEPERLRGKQHTKLWCDELASWRRPEAFEQAMLGLRLGSLPQVVITTTPKPVRLIRELIANPETVLTRGSTYDNRANLSPVFFARIIKRYEGTRIGRQELNAELLEQIEGALWSPAMIDDTRVLKAPDMERIVVAIDPATTSGEDADETGIIVAGKGVDGHAYVLRDLSCRLTSNGWGNRAVNACREFRADRIIAEVTTAEIWSKMSSAPSTGTPLTGLFTPRAARSSGRSRSRRSTNKEGFITSARSRSSKHRCARSCRTTTTVLPTASMLWSGL
jgi:phage terminase large subunit-like protein